MIYELALVVPTCGAIRPSPCEGLGPQVGVHGLAADAELGGQHGFPLASCGAQAQLLRLRGGERGAAARRRGGPVEGLDAGRRAELGRQAERVAAVRRAADVRVRIDA